MLYVVRNGQTDWNNMNIIMGRKDINLNYAGKIHAELLSEKLKDYDIDLIISSPLLRTRQTTNIINKDSNKEVIFDDRLKERDLGNLEGNAYLSEIENKEIWDIKIDTLRYNVEKMSDLKYRVYKFLKEIQKKYKDKNILIVTHESISILIDCFFNEHDYEGSIYNKYIDNQDIREYDSLQKVKTKELV